MEEMDITIETDDKEAVCKVLNELKEKGIIKRMYKCEFDGYPYGT